MLGWVPAVILGTAEGSAQQRSIHSCSERYCLFFLSEKVDDSRYVAVGYGRGCGGGLLILASGRLCM